MKRLLTVAMAAAGVFLAATLTSCATATGQQNHVTLTERGQARSIIVVPPETISWEGDDRSLSRWARHSDEPERMRRLLRDSVLDLAHYLGEMSGAEIAIIETGEVPEGQEHAPIYIGEAAEDVFGPVGISMAERFGFRVVADQRGVGLYGESEYGTSYAIYELLHDLGCRWYLPSEMGECIPDEPTVRIAEVDAPLAPATEWRRMEGRTADADFRRRNRMGGSATDGNVVRAQHALEGYISSEQLEEHPEWRLHNKDGKPMEGNRFRWTRQDVANAIADAIIERLDDRYEPSISLSPGDYVRPTEDPEERKHDPQPRVWEPAANQWSVTDRLIMLANRVADRVGQKYPDVLFGLLAYVNYSMPPAREEVHPNVIPMIAPIDFNRHHPMTWQDHPNETWLLDMVEGWGEAADRIAYYAYGMNLAELTAPNPFITKWGTDIPIIMENNCAFWAPETMDGWDSMMPGFYLSIRMTFYPDEKPDQILDEMWERLYGPAAEPMGRYWHHIDRAWIEAEEYSGCAFGYLQMFTPQVMERARALIDEAQERCETSLQQQRVRMVEDTFSLFELFMRMRRDFAGGKLGNLASDLNDWRGLLRHLRGRYRAQYVLRGLADNYVNRMFGLTYEDASRMEAEYERHGAPMIEWKYRHDEQKRAEQAGWTDPDHDDGDWPTTHVVRQTWSSIGHHNTMGRMAYRTTQQLAALPDGKRAYLWIGATDGSAKLFVNGRHVPYVVPEDTRRHEAGDVIDAFSGYCQPAQFEVTEALQEGENQITILAERTWLNELGTGGLMSPVVLYRDK